MSRIERRQQDIISYTDYFNTTIEDNEEKLKGLTAKKFMKQ